MSLLNKKTQKTLLNNNFSSTDTLKSNSNYRRKSRDNSRRKIRRPKCVERFELEDEIEFSYAKISGELDIDIYYDNQQDDDNHKYNNISSLSVNKETLENNNSNQKSKSISKSQNKDSDLMQQNKILKQQLFKLIKTNKKLRLKNTRLKETISDIETQNNNLVDLNSELSMRNIFLIQSFGNQGMMSNLELPPYMPPNRSPIRPNVKNNCYNTNQPPQHKY